MAVRIFGQFNPRREGEEASEQEGFTELPLDEQIKILRLELWEWATGRSCYRPSCYNATIGSLPAQHEYSLHMIATKALQIEVLLKLSGE